MEQPAYSNQSLSHTRFESRDSKTRLFRTDYNKHLCLIYMIYMDLIMYMDFGLELVCRVPRAPLLLDWH